MSTLWITELSAAAIGSDGMQVGTLPAINEQQVTFTGSAGRSSVLNTATRAVRLRADAACSIKAGDSTVVATAANTPIEANSPEYFRVTGGLFISVIANP